MMGRGHALKEIFVAGRTLSQRTSPQLVEGFTPLISVLGDRSPLQGEHRVELRTGPMASHFLLSAPDQGDHPRLMAWGRASEGQLGDSIACDNMIDASHAITLDSHLNGNELLDAACGSYHTVMVLRQGELIALGSNFHGEVGPYGGESRFTLPGGQVPSQVTAGTDFTVCRTEDGRVLTWGRNEEGQLGRDKTDDSCNQLRTVEIPHPVRSVRAGWAHTLAITENNRVYAWGANNHGQLGIGTTSSGEHHPLEVQLPGPYRLGTEWSSDDIPVTVEQVECGGCYSMMLVREVQQPQRSHVFVWGSHKDGKLGLGSTHDMDAIQPTRLPLDDVAFINSGCDHSVVVQKNGNTYGWGFAQHHVFGEQLARVCMDEPVLLQNVGEKRTQSAWCGQDETFLFAKEQEKTSSPEK